MALYGPSHPARTRAVDASYRILRELQVHDARPEFSFLGDEVVYGQHPLREMRDWEWAARLAAAGVHEVRGYDALLAAGALPSWLFDEALQRTHRSALVRKDPDHYRPLFGDDLSAPDDLPYVWPGGRG